ncbi:MAG: hypothetical protein ABR905_19120 [Terracidiphilus sp.]|jgi:hypothetical protein
MIKIVLPIVLLLFAVLPCARAQPNTSQAERCVRRYAAHLRIVARYIEINAELFSLVESIHAAEAHHGDTSVDRSEPSLRVA